MRYTIQSGDTLGAIAQRFLGDAGRYRELWSLNRKVLEAEQNKGEVRRRLRGPNWIYPGTIIRIPVADKPKGE